MLNCKSCKNYMYIKSIQVKDNAACKKISSELKKTNDTFLNVQNKVMYFYVHEDFYCKHYKKREFNCQLDAVETCCFFDYNPFYDKCSQMVEGVKNKKDCKYWRKYEL